MVWVAISALIPLTTLMLASGLPGDRQRPLRGGRARWGARLAPFLDFTLPHLRPCLRSPILLNVFFVFNSFPIIWVMTEGGPAGATDTLMTSSIERVSASSTMSARRRCPSSSSSSSSALTVLHTRLMWRNVLKS